MQNISSQINEIKDVNSESELKQLELILKTISDKTNLPDDIIKAMFRLFERFPEDDAFGLFNSILHILERQLNYEIFLLKSITTSPSLISISMLNRILNSNIKADKRRKLLNILTIIADCEDYSLIIRTDAKDLLVYQRSAQQGDTPEPVTDF